MTEPTASPGTFFDRAIGKARIPRWQLFKIADYSPDPIDGGWDDGTIEYLRHRASSVGGVNLA
jgi:hypothetical protein